MKTIDEVVAQARSWLRHAEDAEEYHFADSALTKALALWRAYQTASEADRDTIAAIAREIVSDF
jgi:hypothetical protein